jgi:ADP-heptose:LPS heptosyltransferase
VFRDGIEMRTEDHVNFVLTHCALGDGIASLPAIVWARKMHSQDMTMTVWAPTHMLPLFEHLIGGGPGLKFMPLDEFKTVRGKGDDEHAGACVINSVHHNHVTRNRFDMVDFAFATLLDRQPDNDAERCYPHWAPLGPRPYDEPYVVLPVGATNEAGIFHPKVLVPFIEYLLAVGYQPVLTGAHNTHVHTTEKGKPTLLVVRDRVDDIPPGLLEQCTDLRNKTDLMQLRDWCGHANAVVGVDGGTLHLAGTTSVPIVYGCTRIDPRHRGIVRGGEMNWNLIHVTPRELECAGCQSNWTLMFKFNFANCVYNDHKCVEQLTADDFIEATKALGL